MSHDVTKCLTADIAEDVNPIDRVIRQVDDLVNTIAASIEEQSAVASRTFRKAADGDSKARKQMVPLAACIGEIEKEIDGAGAPSEENRGPCHQAEIRRAELPELAEQLTAMVEGFRMGHDASCREGAKETFDASDPDTPFVRWSTRTSSAVPAVDNHPARFLILIHRLRDSMDQSNGRDAHMRILDELFRCTKCPFAAEEVLRGRIPFSDLRLGKRARRRFVGILGELQRRFEKGDPLAVFEAMNTLRDWLIDHMRQVQGRHGPYVH